MGNLHKKGLRLLGHTKVVGDFGFIPETLDASQVG
jgi:hypothetical protein